MQKVVSKKSRTPYIITAVVALVIAGGVFWYLEASGKTQITPAAQKAADEKQEQKVAQDQKAAVADDETIPTSTGTKTPVGEGTYVAPTTSDGITMSADKTSGSEVTVFTELRGYSDGTCSLAITNGTDSYKSNAPVMFQREYSTCAGFTVPISELGTGAWKIALTVTSGGNTQTKSISYEVK